MTSKPQYTPMVYIIQARFNKSFQVLIKIVEGGWWLAVNTVNRPLWWVKLLIVNWTHWAGMNSRGKNVSLVNIYHISDLRWSTWKHGYFVVSWKWLHTIVNKVNSSPPSAAYMRRWTLSALVQIMAYRLVGAKPLSEPMLPYCQSDPEEHITMKFYLKFKYLHSKKCV